MWLDFGGYSDQDFLNSLCMYSSEHTIHQCLASGSTNKLYKFTKLHPLLIGMLLFWQPLLPSSE